MADTPLRSTRRPGPGTPADGRPGGGSARRALSGCGPRGQLASNEGRSGPLPEALEAGIDEHAGAEPLPDSGAYLLRTALAERRGVAFRTSPIAAGADAVIVSVDRGARPGGRDRLWWPSFPSYVLDALKLGAVSKRVPLTDYRYDVDAILGRVGPRTKIVFVCNPNNPTGTTARSRGRATPRRGARRPARGPSTRPTSSSSRSERTTVMAW